MQVVTEIALLPFNRLLPKAVANWTMLHVGLNNSPTVVIIRIWTFTTAVQLFEMQVVIVDEG